MLLNHRLSALKAKQKSLTSRIQNEWCRPEPNQAFLKLLKSRRLRIKEKIATLIQSS